MEEMIVLNECQGVLDPSATIFTIAENLQLIQEPIVFEMIDPTGGEHEKN